MRFCLNKSKQVKRNLHSGKLLNAISSSYLPDAINSVIFAKMKRGKLFLFVCLKGMFVEL